jgi:hypothetical protein
MVWSVQFCIDHDHDLIAPVPEREELTVSIEQNCSTIFCWAQIHPMIYVKVQPTLYNSVMTNLGHEKIVNFVNILRKFVKFGSNLWNCG